ncbi:hypothetical protein JCM33374_g2639 [Metschnikowia sp. JCM 33374]|nr:hypothetical protein JCM33374_g2639 [Metschnikowia sp. JCM 33374]
MVRCPPHTHPHSPPAPPRLDAPTTYAPMDSKKPSTSSQQHEKIAKAFVELEYAIKSNPSAPSALKIIACLKSSLNAFEQAPRALDDYLQTYISSISTLFFAAKEQINASSGFGDVPNALADLIYVLAKVRGHKIVANYLSSDVYVIPRLVELIEAPNMTETHSEAYFLLLWLSRLVLVPFPLETVRLGVDWQLYNVALKYLALHSTASKTQVISSVTLASLVTRADCCHLFSDYTDRVLVDWPVLDTNTKLGHLMTLNQMLKKAPSGPLSDLVPELHRGVILHEIASAKYGSGSHKINTLNALYLLKVSAKVSKFFIAQNQYSSVASLINHTTDLMHYMGELFDASLRECMAKNLAKTVSYLATKAVNYAAQIIAYMFGQLRIPQLVVENNDPAKGSAENSMNFNPHLTLDPAHLSVPRYHTVLLFMGFLALTKSLPVQFVPALFSITHQTCFVSQRNFSFVQTAQIRDASCFCCWAVLRILSKPQFVCLKTQFPQLVPTVFFDLVTVSLFDEDFTMRRCGMAVLQEYVGRFGSVFLGDLLRTEDAARIGEFTIKFIEQFGASTVGSLADSHSIIHALIQMGFAPELFVSPLLDEVLADSSSFELQKLGSRHLAVVLNAEQGHKDNLQLLVGDAVCAGEVVDSLIAALTHTHSALYALAELATAGVLPPGRKSEISSIVERMSLHRHVSQALLGESVMHWLNAAFSITDNEEMARFAPLINTMQKFDATAGLVSEFQAFYTTFHVQTAEEFQYICHQLRSGNKLLAGSIMSSKLNPQQFVQLSTVLRDKMVDADVRCSLISQVSPVSLDPKSFEVFSSTLMDLLDDYTTSEQGDVGSKVRKACISVISNNLGLFSASSIILQKKMLRIAGETIDKLRIAAFGVLCQFFSISDYSTHTDKYYSDYDVYFADVFDLFTQKYSDSAEFADAFWSGLVHSAGTCIGANTMINSSFRSLLHYLRDPVSLENTFNVLVRLLRVPPGVKVSALDRRAQKTVQATLNVIVKIFDSGIELRESINFQTLFVRAYNLHINTTVSARIALVIKIFQHMSTISCVDGDLKAKCRRRLCWISCQHGNGQVRAMAADALFEVVNEVDPDNSVVGLLDTTAWESVKPNTTITCQIDNIFRNI